MLTMTEQGAPQLLTPAQVAQELQVSRDTVYRWMREGKLKKTPVGGQVRIRRRDLDKFIEESKQT